VCLGGCDTYCAVVLLCILWYMKMVGKVMWLRNGGEGVDSVSEFYDVALVTGGHHTGCLLTCRLFRLGLYINIFCMDCYVEYEIDYSYFIGKNTRFHSKDNTIVWNGRERTVQEQ